MDLTFPPSPLCSSIFRCSSDLGIHIGSVSLEILNVKLMNVTPLVSFACQLILQLLPLVKWTLKMQLKLKIVNGA